MRKKQSSPVLMTNASTAKQTLQLLKIMLPSKQTKSLQPKTLLWTLTKLFKTKKLKSKQPWQTTTLKSKKRHVLKKPKLSQKHVPLTLLLATKTRPKTRATTLQASSLQTGNVKQPSTSLKTTLKTMVVSQLSTTHQTLTLSQATL